MTVSAQTPVYVLHIALQHSDPLIARRVKVRSDISLGTLHEVIQEAMGWTDSHLHQFIANKTYYGVPSPDYGGMMLDEEDFTLRDVAPKKGSKLKYEYDFGDSWWHLIKVEKVIGDDPEYKHPECLSGENACPPEDCGGVWGYANMRRALLDPKHEEHAQYQEWFGEEEFDPTAFDLKEVNKALKRIKG